MRKLIVCATHTHTAPTVAVGQYPPPGPGVIEPSEYIEFLVQRLARAAVEAWKERRPGSVRPALAHAAVGFCRRVVYADGTARMYGTSDSPAFMNVEGSEDHGVDILFTHDAGGHYGTMLSEGLVGPEGGQALVDRTVEIIENLFEK